MNPRKIQMIILLTVMIGIIFELKTLLTACLCFNIISAIIMKDYARIGIASLIITSLWLQQPWMMYLAVTYSIAVGLYKQDISKLMFPIGIWTAVGIKFLI